MGRRLSPTSWWSQVRITKLHSPLPALVEHRGSSKLNNWAENSHQPTRQRERAMKRFRTPGAAQRFLAVFSVISRISGPAAIGSPPMTIAPRWPTASPPGTTSPGRRKPPEPRTSTAPEPPSALFPSHLKQVEKARQKDPAWQQDYRANRPAVERKIGRFTRRPWGGRKARCRGRNPHPDRHPGPSRRHQPRPTGHPGPTPGRQRLGNRLTRTHRQRLQAPVTNAVHQTPLGRHQTHRHANPTNGTTSAGS